MLAKKAHVRPMVVDGYLNRIFLFEHLNRTLKEIPKICLIYTFHSVIHSPDAYQISLVRYEQCFVQPDYYHVIYYVTPIQTKPATLVSMFKELCFLSTKFLVAFKFILDRLWLWRIESGNENIVKDLCSVHRKTKSLLTQSICRVFGLIRC